METPPIMNESPEAKPKPHQRESVDIIIIGAGVSGINAARSVKIGCPPETTYIILDSREQLGGTWDLFKYPGIRSDSDMFTFGFSWYPWPKEKPLATGQEIRSADWISGASKWVVTALNETKELVEFQTRFLVFGTGYYDFHEAMRAPIPGLEKFRGDVIQPQFWPKDYNYINKNIVVIGSGATAITLVPSLAEDARHVTMLQRSPTYIAALPMARGLWTRIWQAFLPKSLTNRWNRFQHILVAYMIYNYSRKNPQKVRQALEKASVAQLPSGIPIKPHFTPRYNPWDQRLCVCPDGDFYAALRSTKASIVTDVIEEVTETEVVLKSGQKLQPDVIIQATGLKLQFAGGIKISVDSSIIDPTEKFTWKGCMLQDVPNLVFVVGYVNASWTLGAEATGLLLSRLWGRMRATGSEVALPKMDESSKMEQVPLFELSSTYFQNSSRVSPKEALSMQPLAQYHAKHWNAADSLMKSPGMPQRPLVGLQLELG